MSELIEVIIELSLLNVHDVIFHLHEFISVLGEFFKESDNTCSQSITFGITNFNIFNFSKLNNGTGKVLNVLASFQESIKSNKQSIGGDLPLVLALGFVVKVSVLELVADVNTQGKFVVGFLNRITLDEVEDFLTVYLTAASCDDSVTDFSDDDY